jgi:hypothetical protein
MAVRTLGPLLHAASIWTRMIAAWRCAYVLDRGISPRPASLAAMAMLRLSCCC